MEVKETRAAVEEEDQATIAVETNQATMEEEEAAAAAKVEVSSPDSLEAGKAVVVAEEDSADFLGAKETKEAEAEGADLATTVVEATALGLLSTLLDTADRATRILTGRRLAASPAAAAAVTATARHPRTVTARPRGRR